MARVASFPISPMKAVLGSLPPDATDGDWAYEIKWDGYRTIAHIDAGQLVVQSMSGSDVTDQYPELSDLPASVNARSAVLDGELVVVDEQGTPRFDLMQRHASPVAFYIFDVLGADGYDTTGLPYVDRRHLLDQLVEPGAHHMVPAYRLGDGADLVAATATQGLEGVMAKRADSIYVPGKRSPNWRKIKHRRRIEVTVGGYTLGEGNRASTFGSLLVGRPNGGGALAFQGGIGTGFDQQALEQITAALREIEVSESPFDPPPPPTYRRGARWVAPTLTAIVELTEITNDGLIRHGSFIGFTSGKE